MQPFIALQHEREDAERPLTTLASDEEDISVLCVLVEVALGHGIVRFIKGIMDDRIISGRALAEQLIEHIKTSTKIREYLFSLVENGSYCGTSQLFGLPK